MELTSVAVSAATEPPPGDGDLAPTVITNSCTDIVTRGPSRSSWIMYLKERWQQNKSCSGVSEPLSTGKGVHSERRGGIATAPPLRRSYSDRAVTSPGGAFQTDTNLANHRHRTRLLADCQWRCRRRCGLGWLQDMRSLTKTIPCDWRKLIKLMLRKWTFLLPCSHLICQFVKRHLVTLRREQHVLAQWLRQYFCQDHGVRSVVKV